jgi:adenylosuccinate lyase
MSYHVYQEPLTSRYTSVEMQKLFSEETKFQTWRQCWVALAEAQYELGLTELITLDMINSMRDNVTNIDFALARDKEKEIRHDVMAHVFEFGTKCPLAEGIIHLGATSQYVVCNTDLIIQKKGLSLVKSGILNVVKNLAEFCDKYKA